MCVYNSLRINSKSCTPPSSRLDKVESTGIHRRFLCRVNLALVRRESVACGNRRIGSEIGAYVFADRHVVSVERLESERVGLLGHCNGTRSVSRDRRDKSDARTDEMQSLYAAPQRRKARWYALEWICHRSKVLTAAGGQRHVTGPYRNPILHSAVTKRFAGTERMFQVSSSRAVNSLHIRK